MIVQCDQCNAKFRLDDSKIKDGGAKVRCSKCKHIFMVQKETPGDEADYDSFLNGLVPPSGAEEQPETPPTPPTPAAQVAVAPIEASVAESAATAPQTQPAEKDEFDFGEFAFDSGPVPMPTSTEIPDTPEHGVPGFEEFDSPSEAAPVAADTSDFQEFSWQEEPPSPPASEPDLTDSFGFESPEPPSAPPSEPGSIGEFDFDDSSIVAAASSSSAPVATPHDDFGELVLDERPSAGSSAPVETAAAGEFDFGELDFGGSEKEEAAPVVPAGAVAPEDPFAFIQESPQPFAAATGTSEPAPAFDSEVFPGEDVDLPSVPAFDFGDVAQPAGHGELASPAGDSADLSSVSSFDFSFEPEPAPSESPAPGEGKAEVPPPPFEFGDFEMNDAGAGDKDTSTVSREAWGAETEDPDAAGQTSTVSEPDLPIFADEPPPLSISSRRRGSSILPIVAIAISVLLVVGMATGGFFFFKEGPAGLERIGLGFVVAGLGLEKKEEGTVAVRNPAAVFLQNKAAGEIFVINGEAVNNFPKPRASIQVKATVFGSKGEVLMQKSAYCGNALTREQLATLPLAEMEKAMANAFGDSLSNLAIQPGKAIPFVVVLSNVPKGATDFGVEVVGSTIATK